MAVLLNRDQFNCVAFNCSATVKYTPCVSSLPLHSMPAQRVQCVSVVASRCADIEPERDYDTAHHSDQIWIQNMMCFAPCRDRPCTTSPALNRSELLTEYSRRALEAIKLGQNSVLCLR